MSKVDIYSFGCSIYYMLFKKTVVSKVNMEKSDEEWKMYVFDYDQYKIPLDYDLTLGMLDILHGCLWFDPIKWYGIETLYSHDYWEWDISSYK